MKIIQILFFVCIAVVLSNCNGCQKIPANKYVLNSQDYGKTWHQLNGNETVPQCNLPGCYNVYLPATVMVGDMSSIQRIGAVGQSAKAKFFITYQWEIADPNLFIREAKELKDGDYTSDGSLEFIEGRLVDKHFHDIMGPILQKEPSVKDFDAAAFEKSFLPIINEDMKNFGIRILNCSFVVEFGPQLETAIDVAQALEFYESIGEKELGRDVIKNQAGATKVNLRVDQQGSQTQGE